MRLLLPQPRNTTSTITVHFLIHNNKKSLFLMVRVTLLQQIVSVHGRRWICRKGNWWKYTLIMLWINPLSEQTICNHCDVLVACSIWEVNGQIRQSCLDCQIGQHGGWPKPGLLPLTHMTDTHRKLMAKMCSKKANPDMPNIPKWVFNSWTPIFVYILLYVTYISYPTIAL